MQVSTVGPTGCAAVIRPYPAGAPAHPSARRLVSDCSPELGVRQLESLATGDDGLAVDAGREKDISAVLLVDLQLARRPCAGWSQQKGSGAGTTCDGFPLRLGAEWKSVAFGQPGSVGVGRLPCERELVSGGCGVKGNWRPVVER